MTTNKVDVKYLLCSVSFIRNWLWTGLLLTSSSQTHIAPQQTQTGRGHYGYLWHKKTAESFGRQSASEHILHWHQTRRTGLGLQIDLPCPPTRIITVHLSLQSDLSDFTNASYTHTHRAKHGDNVCKVSSVGDETLTYRHCWGNCCSQSLMALWTGRYRWTLRRRENTINNSMLTVTAL